MEKEIIKKERKMREIGGAKYRGSWLSKKREQEEKENLKRGRGVKRKFHFQILTNVIDMLQLL